MRGFVNEFTETSNRNNPITILIQQDIPPLRSFRCCPRYKKWEAMVGIEILVPVHFSMIEYLKMKRYSDHASGIARAKST